MKKNNIIIFLILGFFFNSYLSYSQSNNSNLGKVIENLKCRKFHIKNQDLTSDYILSQIQNDGSFSDGEPTQKHLNRCIKQLAVDYITSSDSVKEKLRLSIYKSLQYWIDHRPQYIFPSMPFGTLRSVSEIEMTIYDDMMKDIESNSVMSERAKLLIESITEFSRWCWFNGKSPNVFNKNDGHNKGGNVGYRLWSMTAIASCSGDAKNMDWVHQIVQEQFPRVFNSASHKPTGFTQDGSWLQHNGGGAQNYWIGYGVNWVSSVLTYAEVVKNSPWELTKKESNTIADYFLDGIQWYFYKGKGALNIAGRHNALKKPPLDNGFINKEVSRILGALSLDSDKRLKLEELLKKYRNKATALIDSTKYFWNTDLLIHSKPNAYFAVKMISNRTAGCETSEKERSHGKNNFLSGDGSTVIYKSGNEYDKARLVWNWRAWPGITAIQKTGLLPLSPWGKFNKSLNEYAGGLSTGSQAVCAFKYNRKHQYVNLRANKSYFTFENKLFALGSHINKKHKDPFAVWTTINQTERKGNVYYSINGQKGNIKANRNKNLEFKKIEQVSWVHHDNTAYVIIPSEKALAIKLFTEERTGKWSNLDGRYVGKNDSSEIVPVFQLSLSHGINLIDADYSYMIVSDISLKEFKKTFVNIRPEIIQNNEFAQAIKYDTDKYMIVFYKTVNIKLDTNLYISSDVPVIVHLSKESNEWQIRVSDPLHKQKKVELKIKDRDNITSLDIDFPDGFNIGRSIYTTVTFK